MSYELLNVGVSKFRYVLSDKKGGRTLVLLNGGMNTLEMWMKYMEPLSADYQVLLFDYPQELRTNQELVKGMKEFFDKLGVTKPVFIGASDGGMVAQDMFETIFKDYAQEKDISRLIELLEQVLQIHADIRPDIFIPGTTKYTDDELREILKDDTKPVYVAVDENDVCLGYAFCR